MADQPHYTGHRQRLRERYARAGIIGMQDYEVLELLLTYALPRRDVKPIAKQLLQRYGSLAGVLDAPTDQLAAGVGMGDSSAVLLHLVRDITTRYYEDRLHAGPALAPAPAATPHGQDLAHAPRTHTPSALSDPGPVALASADALLDFLRIKLAGLPREQLVAVFLDPAWRVLAHRVLQDGDHDHVALYPRRVVEEAVATRAVGIVLAHNHPSGHAVPSADDIRLTHAVHQAAALLDLKLVDHIIVAGPSYYSFAAQHMLPA